MRSASGLSEELPYSPEECDRPYDNAGKALKILWRWKTKNRVRAHSITCRKTLAMLQNASELTGNATTHLRQSKLLISFALAQPSIAKFAVRRLYAVEECNDSLMAGRTAISMNIATGSPHPPQRDAFSVSQRPRARLPKVRPPVCFKWKRRHTE